MPEVTQEKKDAAQDEKYIISWLKEAIQKQEQFDMTERSKIGESSLERLLNDDHDDGLDVARLQLVDALTADSGLAAIPRDVEMMRESGSDALQEVEDKYFECLRSDNLSKPIANLAEYLLE